MVQIFEPGIFEPGIFEGDEVVADGALRASWAIYPAITATSHAETPALAGDVSIEPALSGSWRLRP